ncbi:type II toxin-antitoxin system death-on-curing family toxin [Devosia alba]|uniref:type II toxin-antitoxin system death-on-curing family toxin n=1 Tax=Devosia alba TaxID=3152360 RepID=UPI0032671408
MTAYLTLDEALYIHAELIRVFGGAPGVRDKGLIESALLRPQTGYYPDLIEETAALWESLAMNHGFIDGNKRVAYACVDLFLGLNGLRLVADNDAIIAFIYTHLEAQTFTKTVLDSWLRDHVAPR